jgi:excinuclease UvrABC ATPase subunit
MLENDNNIEVLGARVHNLKNIDVTIPREKLVVITGLSGSGKSSLAFDTIYAEGQRRYVETFSAYARQFLGGLERPDVDKMMDYRLLLRSNRKLQVKARGRPLEQSLKFTTFYVYCMLVLLMRTVTTPAKKWSRMTMNKSRI